MALLGIITFYVPLMLEKGRVKTEHKSGLTDS